MQMLKNKELVEAAKSLAEGLNAHLIHIGFGVNYEALTFQDILERVKRRSRGRIKKRRKKRRKK